MTTDKPSILYSYNILSLFKFGKTLHVYWGKLGVFLLSLSKKLDLSCLFVDSPLIRLRRYQYDFPDFTHQFPTRLISFISLQKVLNLPVFLQIKFFLLIYDTVILIWNFVKVLVLNVFWRGVKWFLSKGVYDLLAWIVYIRDVELLVLDRLWLFLPCFIVLTMSLSWWLLAILVMFWPFLVVAGCARIWRFLMGTLLWELKLQEIIYTVLIIWIFVVSIEI